MGRSLSVDKGLGAATVPLPAPVQKLFFVRGDVEVAPPACNPRIPQLVREASLVLLGPGSLFTSLVASLVLPGVGEAVLQAKGRASRMLMLNSGPDRESGSMPASAWVVAVVSALSRYGELDMLPRDAIDAVLVSENSALVVDEPALTSMGLGRIIRVACSCRANWVASSHMQGPRCLLPLECASPPCTNSTHIDACAGELHAEGEFCPQSLSRVIHGLLGHAEQGPNSPTQNLEDEEVEEDIKVV
jgi:hypothetical protein